ncbi:hypothetical protein K402DRAFT_85261 [Aulographum hederae CBS 113979]|uniref:Uncharacterized protein n=1 Tax=Aulographum hederae CBS 113979 TaxID=1176131 RepID=A0A6G1H0T7_9PEZI|nr:hypothetical protein K402DRAFT_85261 [Aulographum hederae CBS 113979]
MALRCWPRAATCDLPGAGGCQTPGVGAGDHRCESPRAVGVAAIKRETPRCLSVCAVSCCSGKLHRSPLQSSHCALRCSSCSCSYSSSSSSSSSSFSSSSSPPPPPPSVIPRLAVRTLSSSPFTLLANLLTLSPRGSGAQHNTTPGLHQPALATQLLGGPRQPPSHLAARQSSRP